MGTRRRIILLHDRVLCRSRRILRNRFLFRFSISPFFFPSNQILLSNVKKTHTRACIYLYVYNVTVKRGCNEIRRRHYLFGSNVFIKRSTCAVDKYTAYVTR